MTSPTPEAISAAVASIRYGIELVSRNRRADVAMLGEFRTANTSASSIESMRRVIAEHDLRIAEMEAAIAGLIGSAP